LPVAVEADCELLRAEQRLGGEVEGPACLGENGRDVRVGDIRGVHRLQPKVRRQGQDRDPSRTQQRSRGPGSEEESPLLRRGRTTKGEGGTHPGDGYARVVALETVQ